jgi:hypothetical protein
MKAFSHLGKLFLKKAGGPAKIPLQSFDESLK